MVMRLLEVISFPSCLLYMVFSRIKDIFSLNRSAKIKKNHKLQEFQDNITTIYESSHNYTKKYNLKNINEYGIDAIEDKKLKDGIHTIESIKFDLDFNTLL